VIACVLGLIIPIAFVVPLSVNQTFPSGPGAIPSGMLPAFKPLLNSLIACVAGLIIPTALVVPGSLNHMFPVRTHRDRPDGAPRIQAAGEPSDRPARCDLPDRPVPVAEPEVPSGPATTWAGFGPVALNSVICPIGAAPATPAPNTTSAPSRSAASRIRLNNARLLMQFLLLDPPGPDNPPPTVSGAPVLGSAFSSN
jgi:hypothetical protein